MISEMSERHVVGFHNPLGCESDIPVSETSEEWLSISQLTQRNYRNMDRRILGITPKITTRVIDHHYLPLRPFMLE